MRVTKRTAVVGLVLSACGLALPFVIEEPPQICEDIAGGRYCDIQPGGFARDLDGKPVCVPDSLCSEQESFLPSCDGYAACLPTPVPGGAILTR